VDAAGRPDQRQQLLPPLIRGDLLLALAHFESESRGDVRFLETRAVRTPAGGYLLTGRKSLVLGGASADVLVVSARTSGEARDRHGMSLFLVRPDARGLVRRPFRTVDGGQAAELLMDDVPVDRMSLVGQDGEAITALEDAIDRAIVGACAEAVGAMDRVVTCTRDYLKTRRAYGATLSTLQALQHRLADMLVELELSRSSLYRALAALASWERSSRRIAVSAAKALIGRSARLVGGHGIQLHGGMGMSDDYVIGHLFKRLTTIEALFGTSEFHLTRVASGPDAHDVHPVMLEC
jgi:alkylation response protein AidB-like acyl-CoA dehydrogenase